MNGGAQRDLAPQTQMLRLTVPDFESRRGASRISLS
jgi:hypothetical protein